MNKLIIFTALTAMAASVHAVTIVNSVSDLSFVYSGGASEAGSSSGSLSISSAKNSDAIASLPNAYSLGLNETMSITFDVTLSNEFVSTPTAGDTFNVSFNNGVEFYGVKVNPVVTSNGITFEEDGDTNLGKFNTDALFGTSTHTLTFTIERTGADEMSLTFSSPTISTMPRTVTNDVSPISTIFSELEFAFSGNIWNETFTPGDTTNIATITNLTIDTTGSVIPEPSTYALMLGVATIGVCIARCRRRS